MRNKGDNKVILITGASSGIGWATAKLAGKKGYSLMLTGRREERLQQLQAEILQGGGKAEYCAADLNDLEQIEKLVQESLGHFGRIDVLINNAGFGRLKWLEELEMKEDIAQQIQVNLTACIQLTRAVLPSMIERKSGQIISVISIAGLIGTPKYSVYAASKFGLRGFSEALRREVAFDNIHVSAIYPGGVETEFAEHAGLDHRTGIRTPGWLRLEAEQVGKAILQLVEHPRRQVILPGVMAYLVWINQVFPGLADFVLQRFYTAREKSISK
jgi:short-subunit dehydrogenase